MAEEAVSEARRRGENLAADEESVKAKHLVQKVAKEATTPVTTRPTDVNYQYAENFAVEIRRIETEGATDASGGSVITKLQFIQKEKGKRIFGKCHGCTKRKKLMSTEDKACGHYGSMLG